MFSMVPPERRVPLLSPVGGMARGRKRTASRMKSSTAFFLISARAEPADEQNRLIVELRTMRARSGQQPLGDLGERTVGLSQNGTTGSDSQLVGYAA
jgi:hypothetical protein